MNLDEAKAVIDRAWNSAPKLVDWNDVEEASMVIVAVTGKPYDPELEERNKRMHAHNLARHGAPPPSVTLIELITEMAKTDRRKVRRGR